LIAEFLLFVHANIWSNEEAKENSRRK